MFDIIKYQLFSMIKNHKKNKIAFINKDNLIKQSASVRINQQSAYFQTKWLNTQVKLRSQYKFMLLQPVNWINNTVKFNKSFSKTRNFDLNIKFKHSKLWITLRHSLFNYQYFYLVPGLLIKGFDYNNIYLCVKNHPSAMKISENWKIRLVTFCCNCRIFPDIGKSKSENSASYIYFLKPDEAYFKYILVCEQKSFFSSTDIVITKY